jgi:outer membrane receptor protein involved in Fe transport
MSAASALVMSVGWSNAALAQDSDAATVKSNSGIETVVVTAEKRTESARNVPMGLTALSGDDLVRTQSFRFSDFAGNVPGLTIVQTGVETELVLRGLTTGADLDTGVGVYVDETPMLPASAFALGPLDATDLDTYDMQRLEVLKGPQGTLYGANAVGGLLKYVTNAPDPSGFAASLEAGASSIHDGGEGFDLHGMVNIPLADDLALRVVGYTNYYPGFIDDPARGVKDVDGAHVAGGRASLLWQPNQNLSVRLNLLYQDHKVNDLNSATVDVNPVTLTPIYGPLIQERLIAQPSDSTTNLANLTINWDLGFAKLVSSTSFHHTTINTMDDATSDYGPYAPTYFGQAYGIALPQKVHYSTFAQEARLSSDSDGPLQWLVGGYFTVESSGFAGGLFPIDLTSHQILYNVLTVYGLPFGNYSDPVTYREYAGFANVDYHITPDLDVALGGRYSYNRQHYTAYQSGVLFFGAPPKQPAQSQEGVFTWSGDVRWHFTPESMAYVRVATGYEPGGPNDVNPAAPPTVPRAYQSGTTTNYEVGLKSSLLDNHLTADVALYDIDWNQIQITEVFGGIKAADNAGKARTQGVEWQFNYVPVDGLTLGVNGSYTYAAFTQVDPNVFAAFGAKAGDRLPNVPDWQGSLHAEYERPLFDDYSGFIGANYRFTSERPSTLVPPGYGPRQTLPSYGIFDLRAGIESEQYSLTFYVKNLGDTIKPINLSAETLLYNFGPQNATVTQPRTIGVMATAKF